MSVILGINAYHGDSAASIVVDGKLVAAVEEERFRRIKHWAGFPSESLRYCLREAGRKLSDVDVLAINSDSRAARLQRLWFVAQHRPMLSYVARQVRTRLKRSSIEDLLGAACPGDTFRGRVERVEHHVAHLASTYYLSPWRRAVAVSVDGFGDFASAVWGYAEDGEIHVEKRVHFPHSLGAFYETMTQYLGFPHYGDEYKVMGLAPYGKPSYVDKVHKLINLHPDGTLTLNLAYFRHAREQVVSTWYGGEPIKEALMYTEELIALLGPARRSDEPLEDRHRDLARSVQVVYERALFNILKAAHRAHPFNELVLAGGCAFNSVANGKITRETPFQRVYIQAAAGDAGGAVGAALYAHYRRKPSNAHESVRHAYLGPSFDRSQIRAVLLTHESELKSHGCEVQCMSELPELYRRTAAAIAEGKVVGWFQGRMEWGPRALGNRSILGDPRRADMKDILNIKIKRRESFRPFAPSILREHVKSWFELDDDVPFMTQVWPIREEKRAQVPAVSHVDGSGRLQTVQRETNERFYDLIAAFYVLTGVPVLLNTSFNENEPMVCSPEEALACFLRTKMDVVVLGDFFIERT